MKGYTARCVTGSCQDVNCQGVVSKRFTCCKKMIRLPGAKMEHLNGQRAPIVSILRLDAIAIQEGLDIRMGPKCFSCIIQLFPKKLICLIFNKHRTSNSLMASWMFDVSSHKSFKPSTLHASKTSTLRLYKPYFFIASLRWWRNLWFALGKG